MYRLIGLPVELNAALHVLLMPLESC